MDKFIYFNDMHFGVTPVSRKDDYNKSLLKKLEYILIMARKYNCKVLFGGDLIDKPNISITKILQLMNLLYKYKDIEIIAIRGNYNHDGYQEQSPLNILILADLIKMKNETKYKDFNDCRIIFANNHDNPNEMDKYLNKDKYNILMTHHIIVKNPVIYDHILFDDLKTKADLVLLADYHPRQGIYKRDDGVMFVSIGSLSRRKNTKDNRERNPECFYFIVKDKEIKYKEIKIPCEKDIWVNDEYKIDEKENENIRKNIQKMIENIEDIELNNINVFELLKIQARKNNINENVLNFILKGLEIIE